MQAAALTPKRADVAGSTVGAPRTHSLYESLVMMVDDEPLNIEITQMFLEDMGYHRFVTTSEPTLAMPMIRDRQPDILLLDLMMPGVTGFEILRQIRSDRAFHELPTLILTSTTDGETMETAFELGATDFLAKPVDPIELGLRIQNTLKAKAYRDCLADYSVKLEGEVRRRTSQLEIAQRQVITCLASAAEYRDDDTGQHVLRVGRYAGTLARQLGLAAERADDIEVAAQLHDIGKIGISDAILLKPGRYEPHEYDMMKQHCEIGVSILNADRESGARVADVPKIMSLASSIAATHHERWDGTGYPNGLSGESIPIEGRIVAVADVFDALSSERPYKDPMPLEKCLAILHEGRGSHFDPNCIDAFFESLHLMLEIRDSLTGVVPEESFGDAPGIDSRQRAIEVR